MTGTALVVAGH